MADRFDDLFTTPAKQLRELDDKLQAIEDKEKERQKEHKKALRKLEKEKKKVMEAATVAEEMKDWSDIDAVREQCEEIIKNSNIPAHLKSLKALHEFPKGNYKYQHPVKRSLKTSNIDEEWVKNFITDGGAHGGMTGTIEQLESVATNSRLRAWQRTKRKKARIAKANQEGSGKKNASKAVGVG